MALPSRDQFMSELEHADCPICYNKVEEATQTTCRHIFCLECLTTWLNQSNTCPTCREVLFEEESDSEDDEFSDESDEDMDGYIIYDDFEDIAYDDSEVPDSMSLNGEYMSQLLNTLYGPKPRRDMVRALLRSPRLPVHVRGRSFEETNNFNIHWCFWRRTNSLVN